MTTSHDSPCAGSGVPPPSAPGATDIDALANILAGISLSPSQATVLIGAILTTVSNNSSAPPAATPAASSQAVILPIGEDYDYHMPLPGEAGLFYVVSRGHKVGVFAGWEDTSLLVTGVSGAMYRSATSYADAITHIENALHHGNCAILPGGRSELSSGAGPSAKSSNSGVESFD
ncbi:hypothetical protein ARMGADRAFT_1084329 [Armillaria gallica]|uniref:Ribonuclease H1 N-terminal domain-containing protein n=1 Tax=Armillaria gallica TaxID=47427 RepID=A0A2H3D0G6_ARMGA|nr:hypothetical protein ARMGADRAFT_1084329 [Armillaria gallica]